MLLLRINIHEISAESCKLSIDLPYPNSKEEVVLKYGKVKDGKMKIIKNIHLESVGEMTLITSDDLDLSYDGDSYFFLLEIFTDAQFFADEIFQSENFEPLGKKSKQNLHL